MKYNMSAEVEVVELEMAIRVQYDVEVDVTELFFRETANGCLHRLWFRGDLETYNGFPWEDEEHIRHRNLVKTYLRDVMPEEYQYILVDTSW